MLKLPGGQTDRLITIGHLPSGGALISKASYLGKYAKICKVIKTCRIEPFTDLGHDTKTFWVSSFHHFESVYKAEVYTLKRL